jgi:uncharacterized protein
VNLATTTVLHGVASGIREGFFMFWETLWALVLGFVLSGVVQRFVPKEAMQRRLGDHSFRSVLRASGYGMVSSSCSYAASAMAKTLVARGADFVAAMTFMFASTNLVIELGIVLLALLGWQFLAAQFVGGTIMVVLLALLGGIVLRGRLVEQARARVSRLETHQHSRGHGAGEEARPRRLASLSDASSFAVADATMLRKELVIGYAVAGFLAALVPATTWDRLFLHGHGIWTTLENALVAPLIAVLSWVCSIGNVPLAAALWSGGISFGGVIAFIFADLIAMPLLLTYRRYYGLQLTVRLVAVFYVVMVVAGLVTGALFTVTGLVPTTRSVEFTSTTFEWNYTTFLNLLLLVVAAATYALHRARGRLGAGDGLAFDPVCGMQVDVNGAAASFEDGDAVAYFCSDGCKGRFLEGRADVTR